MSVSFSKSETMQNLMRAFAGESQARNRYTFAAAVCKKQKLQVLEAIFTFTAGQELAHAQVFHQHLSALNGQNIEIDGAYPVTWTNTVLDHLQQSVHNEQEEAAVVYPAFEQIAREEGFPQVAESFHQIAAIEQSHAQRFRTFQQLLAQNKLFVSDTVCGWMCLNCGHIFTGKEAPKVCPVCGHDQGFFIRLELAPYSDLTLLQK